MNKLVRCMSLLFLRKELMINRVTTNSTVNRSASTLLEILHSKEGHRHHHDGEPQQNSTESVLIVGHVEGRPDSAGMHHRGDGVGDGGLRQCLGGDDALFRLNTIKALLQGVIEPNVAQLGATISSRRIPFLLINHEAVLDGDTVGHADRDRRGHVHDARAVLHDEVQQQRSEQEVAEDVGGERTANVGRDVGDALVGCDHGACVVDEDVEGQLEVAEGLGEGDYRVQDVEVAVKDLDQRISSSTIR